jgi:tetratricopeptide (TPR) repeat protein
MDTENSVVQLCLEGSRAEFEKRLDDARALYRQAWESATNDYEACIAAHYVARFQATPKDTLRWNLKALDCARAVGDNRVASFYPSLYVNLGRSYELLGDQAQAQHYYTLAAELGLTHHVE